MDDHIVRIDQHPVRRRQPLNPDILPKSLLDLVGKLNGHRSDLPSRSARCDHHVVRDIRFADERDAHDFLRLVVVKGLKNETMELFDVGGSAAFVGGGLSGTFGQGVSWRKVALRSLERAWRAFGFDDASWVCAHEWRLRRWDLAAGEVERSPVHSTPSSFAPGPKAGRTFEASPSRAPRGQGNHSRAGESPQSALRGLTPSNYAICENLAECRSQATR